MRTGVMQPIDPSEGYRCPHPEDHRGMYVCASCFARAQVVEWTKEALWNRKSQTAGNG